MHWLKVCASDDLDDGNNIKLIDDDDRISTIVYWWNIPIISSIILEGGWPTDVWFPLVLLTDETDRP